MPRTTKDDLDYIRRMAELLKETDLAELAVRRIYSDGERLSVRLSRHGARGPTEVTISSPAAEPFATELPPAGGEAPAPAANGQAVTSPMVGTAYLAPEPGNPPFVSVGGTVKEGQTLLIVEAMKTLNPIPSPRSGTVEQILVENGEPVEYGTPLVVIA